MREAVKQSILENKAVQENQRRLTEHIRSSGLEMRKEIPNDGNCLFHAIADQLERLGETGLNHSDLRKLSVETLKNGVPGVSHYILVLRIVFVGLYCCLLRSFINLYYWLQCLPDFQ